MLNWVFNCLDFLLICSLIQNSLIKSTIAFGTDFTSFITNIIINIHSTLLYLTPDSFFLFDFFRDPRVTYFIYHDEHLTGQMTGCSRFSVKSLFNYGSPFVVLISVFFLLVFKLRAQEKNSTVASDLCEIVWR